MAQIKYKRIMIAVSGNALLGEKESGIDLNAVRQLAEQIKSVYTQHVQIVVSVGGKNIFKSAKAYKEGFDRTTADYIEMMATVMNGLTLQDELEKMGIPTRMQSALQMPAVAESFIRRKAIRHMEKGRVVILCAGTGVPFVTQDAGSALHALELHCDILMRTTKVNGVYESDPEKNPEAKRFETLNFKDAIEIGDLKIIDTAALSMASENDLPILVFALFRDDNLMQAVSGEHVGTLIANDVETKLV
ncbi:MAG: uridylate kinase [Patescibacteria group bacterium]|nr:MAG: uridylate kinase [Patescibacteria group bacterium]